MSKKIVLISTFVFQALLAFSQNEMPKTSFVKLFSGELINAQRIEFESTLLGGENRRIIVDGSKKFTSRSIEFLRTPSGTLYANTGSGSLNKCYAEANNMQLYGGETYVAPANGNPGGTKKVYFFNRGMGTVKKANVANLVHNMQDNPEADIMIKKAQRARIICFGAIGGTVGTMLVSWKVFGNENIGIVDGAITGGFLVTAITTHFIKKVRLKKAVKKYWNFNMEE
jgi:hypothetical protein